MAQSIEGGVVVVNTLSVKNNGGYPLVMAESVQLKEGKSVEDKISELQAGAGNEVISEDEIADLFNNADYLMLPYRDVTQSGPLLIAYYF